MNILFYTIVLFLRKYRFGFLKNKTEIIPYFKYSKVPQFEIEDMISILTNNFCK